MSVPLPATPERATGGLVAALERGRAARLAWTHDGTLLTAEAYATARGISPSVLPELEARGEFFSLDIEGARWYPAELLKLSPDAAGAICQALAGDDPGRQLIVIMRRHGAIAGRTVNEAVAHGRLADVLRLAHAWRQEP